MKGKGFQEFLKCRSEIIKLLEEGHTLIGVFRILSSQGRITTKDKNFYRILHHEGIGKKKIAPLEYGLDIKDEAMSIVAEARKKITQKKSKTIF